MKRKKIHVGLLFGGKSGEHEVSLQSAKSIYEALDTQKYQVVLIGVDKSGRWLLEDTSHYLSNSHDPKRIALNKHHAIEITAFPLQSKARLISLYGGKKITHDIDVFFPIIHGTYGEDGCLQGFLELLDVPYVGAGVLGSAVGMDKDVMKRLLRDAGITTTPFFVLKKSNHTREATKAIVKKLGFPFFVKPANLGSSVGVTKVHRKEELEDAIKTAFQYDTKILFERNVKGREIECSVLGNDNPITSIPGEIIPRSPHKFYSYKAKYIDEHGAALKIPAELSKKHIKIIQDLAIKTFTTLECSGMARVDFFLTERGEVVVNEMNTLPGFTKISMYPKLWEASGIGYSELLDRLIKLSIEKKQQKKKLAYTY